MPEGDAKVLHKDDDDDDDEDTSARFLPIEECLHAEEILKITRFVHFDMFLSRNTQHVVNDMFV